MSISIGARLGHYRILAPLGAGGMGEVWLAEDATLKRKVALKVLPAAMADDPDRLARFQREAETVAALSHPNIVTIYSVERDGDVRFLTMELVEGQSLDQLIPPTGMALTEVLDTGVALADALVASHDKGVVHRDVKPANVMLTKDRRVKVLDFGLAKLREQLELGAKTTTAQITGEGRVLGTVAYMSPEQAEAKPVDARSDLFSLGIVLFEMATGERPFQGDSTLSILSAILRDTPKSVTELRADLPPELARIIRQCLKKDPEERYQTAKDVRNQLRALKSDLDSGQIKGGEAITQPAVGPKSRRRWTTVGAGAMAVIALATVLVWRFRPFVFGGPARPFESIRMKRLTDTGKVGRGAISPDGRYAVYSVTEGGQQSLRLQQIATGSDAQIIPPGKRDYSHLKFSPDGNLVYYIVDTGPRTAALYQISTLGGAELPVIDDVSNFSVSPDGARLALQRSNGSGGESGISVTRLDGTGERRLVTPSGPKRFGDFAWSPDGRTIAALVFTTATWNASHIVLIDAETGKERVLGAPGFRINAYDLEWLPGGFLVVGKADSDPNPNSFPVWMVAYPGTEAMPITHDLNMYQRLSATADGRTMVANQNGYRSNIWVMSPDGQGARQITFGRTALDFAGDWAPDGRLLYSSMSGGKLSGGIWSGAIWSMMPDGSQPRQLTGSGSDPVVSPDGRFIVFVNRSNGSLRRMDIDGRNSRQLTPPTMTGLQKGFFFTPDGASVVFEHQEDRGGTVTNWKVPIEGGESVPLFKSAVPSTPSGATAPPANFVAQAISGDGRWVTGFYPQPNGQVGFAVVSADGTESRRQLSPPAGAFSFIRGTRDGLVFKRYERGVENLWLQPLEGGAPRQLTSFSNEGIIISDFALSRDGRMLAVSRLEATTDLVMITSETKK